MTNPTPEQLRVADEIAEDKFGFKVVRHDDPPDPDGGPNVWFEVLMRGGQEEVLEPDDTKDAMILDLWLGFIALQAEVNALKDPATVHSNILSGRIALTKAQAIHIAGLPADIESELTALRERDGKIAEKCLHGIETTNRIIKDGAFTDIISLLRGRYE